MHLIKHSQLLPEKPTAADTADWYRLGDAVENHGRQMKREAALAEYNSGRNMAAWFRDVSLTEDAGRALLGEARKLEKLLQGEPTLSARQVSQALPSRDAALEYAKAEPEIREVIKEIIKEDPDKEIKVAEIRRLRQENDDLIRRVGAAETTTVREFVNDCSIVVSVNGLLSDLGSGLVDEYFDERLQPAQQERLLRNLQDVINYSQAFVERKSAKQITPITIDV